MELPFLDLIKNKLTLPAKSVANTLTLLADGATIPFIARYRKEATGHLDEVQIAAISNLQKYFSELNLRKIFILQSIEEQGKLTADLKEKISNSFDSDEIEDLYLPFKKRKKTRADLARDHGLEPLAKIIMAQSDRNIDLTAQKFITHHISSIELALSGAQDIISEWISDDADNRDRLKETFRRYATITSTVVKAKKTEASQYKDYFDFSESLARCPSHRFLAMARGEKDGYLKLSLAIDDQRAIEFLNRKYIKKNSSTSDLIIAAIEDGYQRLLFPSIENFIFSESKAKADTDAIIVFSGNLVQLLMAPPLGSKRVLAIDPGFKTGCKIVCLDEQGLLLHNTTIFPNEPQNDKNKATETILSLVNDFKIEAIAIGNGTACRESESFVNSIGLTDVEVYIVSESGASIYSASELARIEFPNQDITVRGAISIGRRLVDPLAELVKIDPKSIGVGQYQHDVNQSLLKDSLDQTVMLCVNRVGVNLNTASEHILTYISGLGPALAKNIIEYRQEIGSFTNRAQLKKVKRLGDKAFEQCAGFLRIREGDNPLDNTSVHPESYFILKKMAKDLAVNMDSFVTENKWRSTIKLENYVTDTIGLTSLVDIMAELDKPGHDPRGKAQVFSFDSFVKKMEDVKEGMRLPGIVTNLTNFGAFVDIGVKQDGLLHISKITKKFIKSPSEVLKLGQHVFVKIVEVDLARKRINLSLID